MSGVRLTTGFVFLLTIPALVGAAQAVRPQAVRARATVVAKTPYKAPAPRPTVVRKAPARPTTVARAAYKAPATRAARVAPVRGRTVRYVRPVRPVWTYQAAPTADRYREIQQALIDKGYLAGPATGTWDASSIAALNTFKRDQNLKTDGKLDSLALIALGLGPKRRTDLAGVTLPLPNLGSPVSSAFAAAEQ